MSKISIMVCIVALQSNMAFSNNINFRTDIDPSMRNKTIKHRLHARVNGTKGNITEKGCSVTVGSEDDTGNSYLDRQRDIYVMKEIVVAC